MRRTCISIALVLFMVVVSCEPEHPRTRRDTSSNTTDRLKLEYRLDVEPTKKTYVAGERVFLKTHIQQLVETPTVDLRWKYPDDSLVVIEYNTSYFSRIVRNCRSEAVKLPPRDATDYKWFEDEGGVQSLGVFDAGIYSGFVDMELTSNWFCFEVVEPTEQEDSLRLLYRLFENIAYKNPESPFHTTLRVMEFHLSRSPNAAFRCDELRRGLNRIVPRGGYETRIPDILSSEDSTQIITLLCGYCDTCPYHIYDSFDAFAMLHELLARSTDAEVPMIDVGAYAHRIGNRALLESITHWYRLHRPNLPLSPGN